jgi:sugar/nucleoside kinase (ribokinase family)
MAFPDPASGGANANWSLILAKTLPFVDLFMPSVEEILFLLHRDQYEHLVAVHGDVLNALTPSLLTDLSAELLAMGTKIVVLKLGSHGLFMRTSSKNDLAGLGRAIPSNLDPWADLILWAPCFVVNVVGTTGAGDATIAGFLSALLRDLSPHETLTAAVGVGASNVEKADALSGLCSWDETQIRIHKGWERCRLAIQHPGWWWDNDHQLWSAM